MSLQLHCPLYYDLSVFVFIQYSLQVVIFFTAQREKIQSLMIGLLVFLIPNQALIWQSVVGRIYFQLSIETNFDNDS